MLVAIAVISALLFIGGAVAYWVVSIPLKDLPNYHELLAKQSTTKNEK